MPDDEATPGATSDVGSTPASTNWYHIYVPFSSGTVSQTALTSLPGGGSFAPDTPLSAGTQTANNCLPNPTKSVPMGSFLHLGATNPDLLTPSGITSSTVGFDANAQATFIRALNLTQVVSNGFLDDYRVRDPDASTVAQRQAESANLYTKGGWRDHTDGNRVTTTAGDKVEIIGGNHVMMILGRPARDNNLNNVTFAGTPNDLHQIETSGGLSYSNDAGPGHIEEVRWVTRSYPPGASPDTPGAGGTWMVRQKSQCCDEVSIAAGLTHESFVGIAVEINSGTAYSYHGAIESMPEDLKNNTDVNLTDIWRDENLESASAPYFTDMSQPEDLVTSIINNRNKVYGPALPPGGFLMGSDSSAGSYALPLQKTVEYAVLDSTYSNATVGTVEEHTTINNSKTEYTTINGTNFEQTTVNGNTSEVSLIAGAKEETDLMIGPVESVAMYMGLKEEISLHASNELTIEIGIAKEEISLVPAVVKLGLDTDELEYKLTKTGIHAEVSEMAAVKTNITEMYNVLSGGVATCLAPMVAMG